MNTSEEQVREIIATQAGEWFVAHRAGSVGAAERRAFYTWLAASPVHVEEYLGVALISRILPAAAADPDISLEAILARSRDEPGSVATLEAAPSPARASSGARMGRRWNWAAVPVALTLIAATLFWWNGARTTSERYATRHGELRTWHLTDGSTLRLNTDTMVTARYSRSARLVEIDRGEALFEVAHSPSRPFRVIAGTTSVLALGTTFDVYREAGSTLVTVVEGRVTVNPNDASGAPVSVTKGERLRVLDGQPPGAATATDVERSTAWLRRKIVFDREPLSLVAAEFNRYSAVPIDIETPALGSLLISGIFSVDDTETFVDFLRTFDGISVAVTPTHIRVFQQPPATPSQPTHHRP